MKKIITAPEAKEKKVEIRSEIDDSENYLLAQERALRHRKALQKYESKKVFTNLVDQLVQNTHGMVGNVKFPGADEEYPHPTQASMRFCTKYYPYAKGGPLYVDYPKTEEEMYKHYEKQKVMKKLKLRHIVVERDSTLENFLEQLDEVI